MREKLLARPVTLLSISALLIILGPVFVFFLSDGSGSSDASVKTKAPVSLVGDWRQTSGNPDAVMKATITPGAIQIDMQTRDSSNVYWIGTFDTKQNTDRPFEVVSTGDVDTMSNLIFASTDKTKQFMYKDGDLSYKFSIMGTTTTVHLSKK